MLGLIASIKNISQNIREIIVQCWFYETSIKILCKAKPDENIDIIMCFHTKLLEINDKIWHLSSLN